MFFSKRKKRFLVLEQVLAYIGENIHIAHWIIFGLIMLAGLNVPISEDLLLLTAGALASSFEESIHLPTFFLIIFIACWISAWEAYWIGRILGRRLMKIWWFNHILPQDRVDKLHYYYEKFGVLTFVFGRFIPGGVRNALFMTSGMGHMRFHRFILRDLVGCCFAVPTIFFLGYAFAENFDAIIAHFKLYENVITTSLITIITLLVLVKICRGRK